MKNWIKSTISVTFVIKNSFFLNQYIKKPRRKTYKYLVQLAKVNLLNYKKRKKKKHKQKKKIRNKKNVKQNKKRRKKKRNNRFNNRNLCCQNKDHSIHILKVFQNLCNFSLMDYKEINQLIHNIQILIFTCVKWQKEWMLICKD